jgi:EAL domain-containing protein (putative c-di-GMP-specific phosphodiesterase class I)/FixJ family two-component response regulator
VKPVKQQHVIRILAVDDEPIMLRLLERMLQQLGHVVTPCNGAQQALQVMDAAEDMPNLILLDLAMPGMDGIEFLRRLAALRYDGAVIIVSGEAESILGSVETLVQTHRIRSLGYLHKPFRQEALAALLDKWRPPESSPSRAAKTIYGADDIRAAIANGELVNHYQPKVSVATGELVGVEALVRWNHPTAGTVFPDQFIGVAETHGLMGQLTRSVLGAAFAQRQAWHARGLSLQMAVNVSMQNLESLGFPDMLASQALAAEVLPEQVVVEVTESRLMDSLTVTLDVLNRLRLKRFRLSIDDFGTGHSTFSQLADIPFDELKVDRGFVHGAATHATLRAIYSASLALGRTLKMHVVAEGVEDRADWDYLRETRCDFAQGYFIGRPMSADALAKWLAGWRTRLKRESLVAA